MADTARKTPEDADEEVVTCAEEMPHLDLQEGIYDCARKLFPELPGQSHHIIVVTTTVEQHAELLLANDMGLREIEAVGTSVSLLGFRCPKTGSMVRRNTDREAMHFLLLECKKLLAMRPADQKSSPIQELREKILENARKCFPRTVENFTSVRVTHTVVKRDSKYRLVAREVPVIIPKSEIFDIAIAEGAAGSLQASLVYGEIENLKYALHGEEKGTYFAAMESLLRATAERLDYMREVWRASPLMKTSADRKDSAAAFSQTDEIKKEDAEAAIQGRI